MQLHSHRLIEKLKKIVQSDEPRFNLTDALSEFSNDFNIGIIKGKSLYLTQDNKTEIEKLLILKGHSLTSSPSENMTRSEKLAITPNEKAGGGSLKRNRISIKSLHQKPLLLNGKKLILPAMSHLDINILSIESTGHDCVILVENYDNFNNIHLNSITLPTVLRAPLVIYRGDKNESRLDAVLSFLEQSKLPVIAYVDIDPFGLVNVHGLSNIVGVLAPEKSVLEALLSDTRTKRSDLYERHYAGCYAILDGLKEGHPCKEFWELIKKHKAGVVQEQFLRLSSQLLVSAAYNNS